MTTTTIQTAKKRANSMIGCEISASEPTVLVFRLWDHVQGRDKPEVTEEYRFDTAKCHEAIRARAVVHGLKQRLADGAAKGKFHEKTGKLITAAEKFAGIKKLGEHYLSGTDQWELRSSGPREAVDQEAENRLVLKGALGIVKVEKTPEEIHAFVMGLNKAQIAALMVHKDLVEAVALVREGLKEKEAEGVDAEELLSSF